MQIVVWNLHTVEENNIRDGNGLVLNGDMTRPASIRGMFEFGAGMGLDMFRLRGGFGFWMWSTCSVNPYVHYYADIV